jgi:DNA-directed RNA polymerase specialized sigma24 family protein
MTLADSPNGESVDAEVAKAALVTEARGIRSMWLEEDPDDPVSLDDLNRAATAERMAEYIEKLPASDDRLIMLAQVSGFDSERSRRRSSTGRRATCA